MSKSWKTKYTPKLFTILTSGYRFTDFRTDVLAGLTVALVALPLSMALAIACGANPEKGLVTAVIAGFLISFFGGSRVQIGGPTGAFVVVVFNVIVEHGYEGLLTATIMAGIILILAGYIGFGQVIKFVPKPVVIGFTTGIAVIIASTQVKDFLGLRLDAVSADFIPQWKAYFSAFGTISISTALIGFFALLAMIFLRKFAPKWPEFLIVLILSSLAVSLMDISVETLGSQFPGIQPGITFPSLSPFTFNKIGLLLPSAFTIAFLAGIEALLSAIVSDGMTGYRHRSNQELIGVGIANIGSAFFGGLPATGAIARTATNVTAGGKSPVAGIFHAIFLLLFMLFGIDLIKFVPMPALAAVLFLVAWGMSETHHFIRILKLSSMDRVVLVLTFLLTIFVSLTVAIGVGITIASLLFMVRMSKSVEISRGPKRFEKGSEEPNQREKLPPGVEVFWIAGPVFFGMAAELVDILKRIGHIPKVLIIRMRLVPYLDATGADALNDLVKKCHSNDITVIFSSIQKQPAQIMSSFQKDLVNREYSKNYEEAIALAKKIIRQSKK